MVNRVLSRRWWPRPWLGAMLLAALLAACGGSASTPGSTPPPGMAVPGTTAQQTAPGGLPSPTTAATPPGGAATRTTGNVATPSAMVTRPAAASPARGATTTSTAGTPAPASAGPPQPQTLLVPAQAGQAQATQQRTITLPAGFQINLFATGLGGARLLAWSPEGALVVSEEGVSGRVSVLTDRDRNGVADERVTFVQGLRNPHGLAFRDGYLYIAAENQVVRARWQGGAAAQGNPEVIIPNLPTGGHSTRTIGFGPDGKLYLAVGSSCNVCNEQDERRAALYQYNADGSGGRLYARGLRNAVGFVWQPGTGALWATNNGRDGLGDDLPPETINLVREGDDFGWPYCHNGRIADPQFGRGRDCGTVAQPAIEVQAHSAPLGLAFYSGQSFPADYSGDLFVAYHGSWNRSIPTGYKVVRARFRGGQPTGQVEDFATGWLPDGSQSSWGRPVDVSVGPEGSLYVSDDTLGVIYRISYGGR